MQNRLVTSVGPRQQHRLTPRRWGVSATGCVLVATLVPVVAGAARASGGAEVSPSAGDSGKVVAVSASSRSDAWFVGFTNTSSYVDQLLVDGRHYTYAEHWDGNSLSTVATPLVGYRSSDFNAVADLGPNDAWAVGYTIEHGLQSRKALTEHWDGSQWSVVTTPKSAPIPTAVVAISTDDVWAVGDGASLHWDGSSWTTVAIPHPPKQVASLTSVSGTASDDVWAVGDLGGGRHGHVHAPVIMHWDGSAWSQIPSGAGDDVNLRGVTAISPTDAWAVGSEGYDSDTTPLVEHWDGTSWTVDSTAVMDAGVLYSVSSSSGDDVWAVGSPGYSQKGGFIEHFDGTSWSKVKSPRATYPWLSVSADSPHNAWVAAYPKSVAQWNGTSWKIRK